MIARCDSRARRATFRLKRAKKDRRTEEAIHARHNLFILNLLVNYKGRKLDEATVTFERNEISN